jgi:hypothetical protein
MVNIFRFVFCLNFIFSPTFKNGIEALFYS